MIALKKAIITIISVFAVLFCLVSLILPRYKAEIYTLMYPRNLSVESDLSVKEVQLKKGDHFILGKCYGDPIVWEIIDCKKKTLVWSDNAVCFREYDDESADWKTSELRDWLNDEAENGFLCDTNFSSSDKDLIYDDHSTEKMFILSKPQLEQFSPGERVKAPTAEAVRNCDSDKLVIRRNCWYWTSSGINTNSSSVTAVTQRGDFYKTLMSDPLVGVCPAFYLRSNKVTVCGGNGSAEEPYIIATGGESR